MIDEKKLEKDLKNFCEDEYPEESAICRVGGHHVINKIKREYSTLFK